jgi:hypothetical protein
MVMVVEMAVAVEDVVTLVVMVGLVAVVEVTGGQGGGGNDRLSFINSVDVLDPTQNFMNKAWRKLVYNGGWLYVAQAHE